MAQNSQTQKQKWGVGSFFQQAVAGVESRLDHILMDEDGNQTSVAKSTDTQGGEEPPTKAPIASVSRSSSTARRNDRLQERLARAMMKQNASNLSSQSPQNRVSSPPVSPVPSNGTRSSMDIDSSVASVNSAAEDPKISQPNDDSNAAKLESPRISYDSGASPRVSTDISVADSAPRISLDVAHPSTDSAKASQDMSGSQRNEILSDIASGDSPRVSVESPSEIPEGEKPDIARLQAEHKIAESQWQEEMHGYIERIDALQSKLKYLAKDAAESAKNAAASATPGSVQKQLLEKDEKIALLLEEGQKLSKSEMDHRTVIKKLRQQLTENTKSQTEMKRKTDKLERDLVNSEARAKRAEAAEKRANESLSSQTKSTKDLEAVTNERNALSQTVQEIKSQLSRAVSRAETAETKANSDALELERQRATELDEELCNLKIERDISEEKSKREITELKEKMEQEKERARMLEAELKGEQSLLESKMESLRSRAEEASSGATGETQAKLLRQIETLQTQYAAASENWHTLEGSLLARLASVEKERDDTGRREVDLRKKIREMNQKLKKLEEELDNAKEAEHDLDSRLEERMEELQKLQHKLEKAAEDLASTQKDMAEQKKTCDATWAQKLEEERAKWREQVNSPSNLRGVSPVASLRRSSTLDTMNAGLSDFRPPSRRSSAMPFASPEIGTPPRQNSYPASITQATLSPPHINTNSSFMGAPSISFEPEEYFEDSGTPATPSAYGGTQAPPSRGINDIISESTVGAGPSVQLVERMSATVRRLESERAGSKDELARVTTQRDEARQQVVDLMRELEEKQHSTSRVQELEAELEDLDQRYQTTLEMLGEKSEQVDELNADIADLKKIYRELVDSTMK
ncbi:M protein repeat protein [Penicillium concentricum]|uniref:M protein repeat protein n=1 Tax=Penicillium concentricum TaxID=293559 RepID=A0A9W9VKK9_9EURO|nr:M protein repeat protein [Penicillium concentricum]KAJ5382915.1 M protein repeat protein [Penicillium concentricum]